MKKALTALLCAFVSNLFAASFFSGETGISASFINKKEHGFEPALLFNGFFAGQFALTNEFFVRSELSLQTSDLYDEGITNEAGATFKISELSAHYIKSFGGATHELALFRGDFETIGSQQFIRRRLGVQYYGSALTENYLGLNGVSAYAIHGVGGSYSLTMKTLPISTGIVISRNNDAANADNKPELNADWRLATAFKYFTMDMLIGGSAPIKRENDKGDDVFLLIDTLYLHGGFDILFGSHYSPFALYTLSGFSIPVKKNAKTEDLEPEDIFLLIEPRISFGKLKIYFTAYNIPNKTTNNKLGKFLFIEESLGANIRIFSDQLSTENRDFTFGISGNVGFEGKFFDDITDFKGSEIKDFMNIAVTPFAEIEANKGLLKLALQVSPTKINDEKPQAIKLHVGYKKEL